jgi:hypothetical protein
MTALPERLAVMALVAEAVGAGARQDKARGNLVQRTHAAALAA